MSLVKHGSYQRIALVYALRQNTGSINTTLREGHSAKGRSKGEFKAVTIEEHQAGALVFVHYNYLYSSLEATSA